MMDKEEKVRIIGTLVLEQDALHEELCFIDVKLEAVAEGLSELCQNVGSRVRKRQAGAGNTKLPAAVVEYSDLSKLLVLFQQQDSLIERLHKSKESLATLRG